MIIVVSEFLVHIPTGEARGLGDRRDNSRIWTLQTNPHCRLQFGGKSVVLGQEREGIKEND